MEKNADASNTTIYLGLYNASKYVSSLERQLLSQEIDLPIVVADNHSDDDTWHLISHWLDLFHGRITLIRNPINLGGAGSLLLNSDFITTPWFITMHQDDFYKSNHARILAGAISTAAATTICITTEMQSMDNDGRRLPTPPRASWFLPDFQPATIFLANLKNHVVPFPAAAFRKDAFFSVRTPWHSTAFPDTEWVLRSAVNGGFEFIPVETMVYRENPGSESHSLDSKAAQSGAFNALLRVFSSSSFLQLCDSILDGDRTKFATTVFTGLEVRLSDPAFCALIKLVAAEQMAVSWNYGEPASLSAIREHYRLSGERHAVQLLDRLAGGTDSSGELQEQPPLFEPSDQPEYKESRFLVPFKWLYGSLPRRARKFLIYVFRSSIAKVKPSWNFRWKNK